MNILLDRDARPVIGHRGNRAHAPENTIESFAQAIAVGADAIEFDVHVSADGIPVVHHDKTIARTTDGSGEVARMTFAELKRADAGANYTNDGGKTFPYRGAGHRIPSFEEVVDAFPEIPLLIEIKAPLAATGVRRIIEQRKAVDRVVVDSMRSEGLTPFAGSGIALGASRNGSARLLWEIASGRRVAVSFKALCLPLAYKGVPLPIKRFAETAPKHDVRVHIWTVNSPIVARRLWSYGVNGIITDDPAVMLKERLSLIANSK